MGIGKSYAWLQAIREGFLTSPWWSCAKPQRISQPHSRRPFRWGPFARAGDQRRPVYCGSFCWMGIYLQLGWSRRGGGQNERLDHGAGQAVHLCEQIPHPKAWKEGRRSPPKFVREVQSGSAVCRRRVCVREHDSKTAHSSRDSCHVAHCKERSDEVEGEDARGTSCASRVFSWFSNRISSQIITSMSVRIGRRYTCWKWALMRIDIRELVTEKLELTYNQIHTSSTHY